MGLKSGAMSHAPDLKPSNLTLTSLPPEAQTKATSLPLGKQRHLDILECPLNLTQTCLIFT